MAAQNIKPLDVWSNGIFSDDENKKIAREVVSKLFNENLQEVFSWQELKNMNIHQDGVPMPKYHYRPERVGRRKGKRAIRTKVKYAPDIVQVVSVVPKRRGWIELQVTYMSEGELVRKPKTYEEQSNMLGEIYRKSERQKKLEKKIQSDIQFRKDIADGKFDNTGMEGKFDDDKLKKGIEDAKKALLHLKNRIITLRERLHEPDIKTYKLWNPYGNNGGDVIHPSDKLKILMGTALNKVETLRQNARLPYAPVPDRRRLAQTTSHPIISGASHQLTDLSAQSSLPAPQVTSSCLSGLPAIAVGSFVAGFVLYKAVNFWRSLKEATSEPETDIEAGSRQ